MPLDHCFAVYVVLGRSRPHLRNSQHASTVTLSTDWTVRLVLSTNATHGANHQNPLSIQIELSCAGKPVTDSCRFGEVVTLKRKTARPAASSL